MEWNIISQFHTFVEFDTRLKKSQSVKTEYIKNINILDSVDHACHMDQGETVSPLQGDPPNLST